jgi:Zn-dependent membrane protease YugP
MPFFSWSPMYWLFVGPALLFVMFAQWRVQSAYRKWGRVANSSGLAGAQIAERLISENGLHGLRIQGISGKLTDNYDPRSKVLNLSESTARQNSVAAAAIVAHEMGHAMQDSTGSLLLRLRSGIVPVVNFGSQLGPILFLIGILLRFGPLMWLGIAFFSLAFVFALITLPVEINASQRAMKMLTTSNLLVGNDERRGARAVLSAAALTYVGSLLVALTQLLYYVSLASGGKRRR